MSLLDNISLDFSLPLVGGGGFGLSSSSFMVKAVAGTWGIWTYRNGEVVETRVETVDWGSEYGRKCEILVGWVGIFSVGGADVA
jgi:hypothetical protein